MQSLYLILIIFSALFHAIHNSLLRIAKGDRIVLTWIFLLSSIIALCGALLNNELTSINVTYIPYIIGASFFYTLYQIFTSKAYAEGNIISFYPLTLLSPVFIPIWAYFFLGETISLISVIGIVITLTGALSLKLQNFTIKEFKQMFHPQGDYKGARYALFASFLYSLAAVFDKSKIACFHITNYLFILLTAMGLFMLFYYKLIKQHDIMAGLKKNWKIITSSGIILYCSFLTFRLALQHVYVSIAVPVRLSSVIFALFIGVLLLKERLSMKIAIGSIIIVIGILLINCGIN